MTSHSEPKGAPILQVLIVAYGREGIDSVASLAHPEVEGVEYLVSWQTADCLELTVAAPEEIQAAIPAALREREDFRIFPSDTSGVSLNRNLVLDRASAPLAICSDDDVAYLPEDLHNIIETFNRHPEADFIAFEYRSDTPKRYPSESFDLARPPKGYYIGGPEMAFRLESIRRHGIRFNEWFGIGCEFPAGEEDLFLADCLDAGLKCIFLHRRKRASVADLHPHQRGDPRPPSSRHMALAHDTPRAPLTNSTLAKGIPGLLPLLAPRRRRLASP